MGEERTGGCQEITKSARKQILEAKFLTSKLSLVGFGKCLSLEVTKYKLYEVCLGVCRSDAIPWREEALDKFSASPSAALVCITKKRYSEFCPPKLSKEETLSSINLWLFLFGNPVSLLPSHRKHLLMSLVPFIKNQCPSSCAEHWWAGETVALCLGQIIFTGPVPWLANLGKHNSFFCC